MVKELYVGAHASIVNGFNVAIKNIINIGGNAVQVFLKNPRGRGAKPLNEIDITATRDIINKYKVFFVGHCSYLLNFARSHNESKYAISSLIEDLERISKLGGVGVVLHIGKYLKLTKEEAIKNIVENINYVLNNSPKNVKIIFENTAGQGTEIGYKFSELKEIYEKLNKHERIGFCIDTCHSFAAGYNLLTIEGIKNWKEEFDELIGWDKVTCIHFNDSLRECGSRVDRHANLLEGKIGKTGLKEIAKICYETGKPMILETPGGYDVYEKEISLIKSWVN